MTDRKCSKCQQIKSASDFPGSDRRCKPCKAAYNAQWRKSNPERARDIDRRYRARPGFTRTRNRAKEKAGVIRRKYGITPADVEQMVCETKGLCAICAINPAQAIDHCHTTGLVRGTLCNPCNLALGFFRDSSKSLAAAISYLNQKATEG